MEKMNRSIITILREAETLLNMGEIPELIPNMDIPFSERLYNPSYMTYDERLEMFEFRHQYTKKYGFTLIDKRWISTLINTVIKDGKVLEVMGGSGYLSWALNKMGVNDIICTDNYSWANGTKPEWLNSIPFEVESLDAIEAIKKYGKDIDFLLMSWPYMDSLAYDVLMTLREVNPKATLIYIGEDYGGCTANDDFFEAVEYINRDLATEVNDVFPSFDGIHDRVYLCK